MSACDIHSQISWQRVHIYAWTTHDWRVFAFSEDFFAGLHVSITTKHIWPDKARTTKTASVTIGSVCQREGTTRTSRIAPLCRPEDGRFMNIMTWSTCTSVVTNMKVPPHYFARRRTWSPTLGLFLCTVLVTGSSMVFLVCSPIFHTRSLGLRSLFGLVLLASSCADCSLLLLRGRFW